MNRLPVLLLSLGFVSAPISFAASFDCEKAASSIEKTICADSQLSNLDKQLMTVYKVSLVHADYPEQLKAEQREWIKKIRNKCDDSSCLKAVYSSRVAVLQSKTMQEKSVSPSITLPSALLKPVETQSSTTQTNPSAQRVVTTELQRLTNSLGSSNNQQVQTCEIYSDSYKNIKNFRLNPNAMDVHPSPDICTAKFILLSDKEKIQLANSRRNADALYKFGEDQYFREHFGLFGNHGDLPRAAHDLRWAAYLGHPDAPALLGIIIAKGYRNEDAPVGKRDVAADVEDAKQLFELAIARNSKTGYVGQGDLAANGWGEPVNMQKAIGLYEKGGNGIQNLGARRIARLTLLSKDLSIVKQANSALIRSGAPREVVVSEVDFVKNGRRETVAAVCPSMQQEYRKALITGDREAARNLKSYGKDIGCKVDSD